MAASASAQKVPAFPTAEGFGKWATGGRGGQVVEVTTLADDADNPIQGSLRWALKQYSKEPITVVFRVSGTIRLAADLRCNRTAGTTIAGQTAPGDGICIRGAKCNFGGCANLVIRHIRFRIGLDDEENFLKGGSIGIENATNWIIDHCTFGWSGEENMTIYDNTLTTVQWCIVHEGLYDAGHGKGVRGYGCQWGGQSATYHHNLLAHNKSRSPRLNGARSNDHNVLIDYVNNVNYNWGGSGACYGADWDENGQTQRINFVGNYYKPGPAYPGTKSSKFCNNSSGSNPNKKCTQWYMSGNYMEGSANTAVNSDNYRGLDYSEYTSLGYKKSDICKSSAFEIPDPVSTETAANAYKSVLAGAGAFPRDTVDRRIIKEVKNGKATYTGSQSGVAPGIIDRPSDVGGYPDLKTYNEITDNDHDGMDDAWETANGFDPANPLDRNYILKSGYTALEAYLCSLVGETIPIEKSNPFDVTVAQDGSGDYKTINAAIESIPEDGKRHTIFIKNGTYKEKVFVGTHYATLNKTISMIGEDVDKVIITWDDYAGCTIEDYPGKGTITNAGGQYIATMTVNAKDFYMENVTVQNTYSKAQAIALYQCSDGQILKNCKILGFQDTHRTKKGARYFYYDCTIEGHVDFIYAGGTCYFYRCNIVSVGDGYLTAPEDIPYYALRENGKKLYYGLIFNDCNLTAKNSSIKAYLGRPWAGESGSIFMNCRLGSHIRPEGWSKMGDESYKTTSMGEYKSMNAAGTALADVSKRVDWSFQLTENEYYNLMNLKTIYSAVNKQKTFDPLNEVVAVYPPANFKASGRSLSWSPVDGAVAYAVYADGVLLDYTATNSYYDVRETIGQPSYQVKSVAQNGWMSPFNGTPYNLTYNLLDSLLNPDHRVKIATEVVPKGAGTITRTPSYPTCVLGTTLSLTATPAFGYKFLYWTNAAGDTLSTDDVYEHPVTAADTIRGYFGPKPTFVLNCEMKGGKPSLLTQSPQPKSVGGRLVYEEGTEVTLTASNHHYHAFSHWDDGSTELERVIVMTCDTTVTAFFTDSAYLLAWDFSTEGNKAYKANQQRESSLSGTLYLTDDKGKQYAWNDYSTLKGGWMGQPAACNGNSVSNNAYFYIKCSVEDYGKLRISFSYGAKNHVWSRYVLQCAADDGDYTDFGSISLSQSTLGKWVSADLTLPSSLDNCEEVRIRWYPDVTSKFMGNKYGYEGFSLSEIYLLSGDIQPEPPAALPSLLEGSDGQIERHVIYDLCGNKVSFGEGQADIRPLRRGLYIIELIYTDGTRRVNKVNNNSL